MWKRCIRPGAATGARAIARPWAALPRCGSWQVAAVRTVVVGPAQFNAGLEAVGLKSDVHYLAFEQLLRLVWERSADLVPTYVSGDKHGGRHYYFQRLSQSFPDAWIDRGLEGPDLSRYTIRRAGQRLELRLRPEPTRMTGWSRSRRLSARPCASCGWTSSIATGVRAGRVFVPRPVIPTTPSGSVAKSPPRPPLWTAMPLAGGVSSRAVTHLLGRRQRRGSPALGGRAAQRSR